VGSERPSLESSCCSGEREEEGRGEKIDGKEVSMGLENDDIRKSMVVVSDQKRNDEAKIIKSHIKWLPAWLKICTG
jgi:hypothetical protein